MNEKQSVIFPIGEKIDNSNFQGDAFLMMLTTKDLPIANVTFAPGSRNHWHEHRGGQTLLVTGGSGWYQEWGKEAQRLHPGDVVEIPPHVKHWHGASANEWLAHLAIELHPELGPAIWLEEVSEEQYKMIE